MLNKYELGAIAKVLNYAIDNQEAFTDGDNPEADELFLTLLTSGKNSIESLQRGDTIGDYWSIEDVKGLREEYDEETDEIISGEVSDELARDVLRTVKKNHDAEMGINWDVLRYYLDDLDDEDAE